MANSRFPLATFYALAWLSLAIVQIVRGASPARYFIWTGSAEWAGLLLVMAIAGWLIRRPRVAGTLRFSPNGERTFMVAQALVLAAIALSVGWIATDFSFDGLGAGVALFGLAGRACACPSALMLLGASIVMAWQSTGRWRAAWQFTAMVAGLLFTVSVGWARIDAASKAPWLERSVDLTISTAMMTTMTRAGLSWGLPRQSDWIPRGRQASPAFAGAALLMFVVVLIQRFWPGS